MDQKVWKMIFFFTRLRDLSLLINVVEARILKSQGATSVKTYVNMRVQKIFKWTHISEVHSYRITKNIPLALKRVVKKIPLLPKLSQNDTLISDLLRSKPCSEKSTHFWVFSDKHVNMISMSGPPGFKMTICTKKNSRPTQCVPNKPLQPTWPPYPSLSPHNTSSCATETGPPDSSTWLILSVCHSVLATGY